MLYDAVIVGGGPGGLQAALTLGRARKRVLLCDAGPRRNAAAHHLYNFVTRDRTPPDEFRQIARRQLAEYPNVQVRDVPVHAISGARGAFHVDLASGTVAARRVLLCTGMIDDVPALDGFQELWGHAVFQCPYCHGWEVQDRKWGYLARAEDSQMLVPFALQLRGWTRNVTVFTDGKVEIPAEERARLEGAGIRVETDRVVRLVRVGNRLESVQLSGTTQVPCDALFAHPPQRQVELVRTLGVALDEHGYVQVDAVKFETSLPGIYAAGDLTTRGQSAVFAAAAGARAASMINVELTTELATSRAI